MEPSVAPFVWRGPLSVVEFPVSVVDIPEVTVVELPGPEVKVVELPGWRSENGPDGHQHVEKADAQIPGWRSENGDSDTLPCLGP